MSSANLEKKQPVSFVRMFAACVFGFLVFNSAFGAEPDRTIAQFNHTSWTIKDGAPGGISSLAQTTDGYLWLGTNTGLFRFDGIRFERFEPLHGEQFSSVSIQSLFAPPTGGLWIGYQLVGASFLKDGHITNYTQQEGLTSTVHGFEADRAGVIWAATEFGLMRLENSGWLKIGQESNYSGNSAKSVLIDRDGTLWVATEDSIVFLPQGAKQFKLSGVKVGWVGRMAQAPNGKIWLAESSSKGSVRSLTLKKNGELIISLETQVESAGLIFDREDSLWIAGLGNGIRRVSSSEHPSNQSIDGLESFTQKDGLTADYVWPVLEDREGNIWFGTSGGLDRFRRSLLVPAEFPEGSNHFALAAGDRGTVWAGTTNRHLMRLQEKKVFFKEVKPEITCAYRDNDGLIWLGGPNGIWRIAGEEIIKIASLPDGITEQVQSLTKDRSGALWISGIKMPLMKLTNGVWTRVENQHELSKKIALTASTDTVGRIWLGYLRNRIMVIDKEDAQVFSSEAGLEVGNVTAIVHGAKRTLVGGERGLAFFDGNRFRMVKTGGSDALTGISAIIETDNGDLWIHSVSGIFHLPSAEIERTINEADYPVQYERFDFLDGLPGPPSDLRPSPTGIKGTDGRLWFATLNGVVWLDPQRISRNPLPPTVSIQFAFADGKLYPLPSKLNLPIQTNHLQIDYNGLSLSIPERVRFRYRLEGVDSEWQDAGTRRQAFYNNLAPGNYRFRVIACNNDGVWNEEGAVLEFSIAPAFYQTNWFLLFCAAIAGSVVWAFYGWRVRQVRSRLRWQFEERLSERTRIAQELHDSLLQRVFSASIQVDAVAEQTNNKSLLKPRLSRIQHLMALIMKEGRVTIRDLQLPKSVNSLVLEKAFSEIKRDFDVGEQVDFRLTVKGNARRIFPIVRYEIYCIGREALINAFHHSKAEIIEVEIEYQTKYIRVLIRDNGDGINPEILRFGRAGHLGLSGMRKRAEKLKGKLKIRSQEKTETSLDGGTSIELFVPGQIAFENYSKGGLLGWLSDAKLPCPAEEDYE